MRGVVCGLLVAACASGAGEAADAAADGTMRDAGAMEGGVADLGAEAGADGGEGDAGRDAGSDGGSLADRWVALGDELEGFLFDVAVLADGGLVVATQPGGGAQPRVFEREGDGWRELSLPFGADVRPTVDLVAALDGRLVVGGVLDAEDGPLRVLQRDEEAWTSLAETTVGEGGLFRLLFHGSERLLAHVAERTFTTGSLPGVFSNDALYLKELGSPEAPTRIEVPDIACSEFPTPRVVTAFDAAGTVVAAHSGVLCDAESWYLRELTSENVWQTRFSSTTRSYAQGLALDSAEGTLIGYFQDTIFQPVETCTLGDDLADCGAPPPTGRACGGARAFQPSARLATLPAGGAIVGHVDVCCVPQMDGSFSCTRDDAVLWLAGTTVPAPEGGLIGVVAALPDGDVFAGVGGQAYRLDLP